MNIMFWTLLILMLFGAIAMMVWPLLRVSNRAMLAYRQSNLEINRQKLDELDLDLKEGRIDEAMYRVARDELDRELLVDIPEENADTAAQHYTATAQRQPAAAMIIALFVPAFAFLVYLQLGMHSASDQDFVASQRSAQQPGQQQGQQQAQGEMDIAVMAERLSQRLQDQGGSAEDWAMLGRAHKYLQEYALAAKAFDVALKEDTDNSQLMLEMAEVLALENNREINEPARALIMRAYELAPNDPNSLWFAGVAEYQAENYQQAIDRLVALLPMAMGEEDVMKSVIAIVSESRKELIAQGKEMPELEELLGIKELVQQMNADRAADNSIAEAPAAAPAQTAAASGRQITVKVDVDDPTRARFDAGDTVFIYAKAKQGPRMPLAVQRLVLSDLPATVTLDDSMAMVEGMNLSSFDPVVVSARISRAGSAIAQTGDYIGYAESVAGSNDALSIVIDEAVQ
jgi:cytochrome c-type biogenesis protein CcmH